MPDSTARSWTARLGTTTLRRLRLVASGMTVVLVAMGLMEFREGDQARGWAIVAGRINSSTVNEYTARDGTRHYRPLVIYTFGVDGSRYMSSRLSFRTVDSTSRADADAVVKAYPIGRPVTVHYDPADPQQAVLEPRNPAWTPLILAGVCASLALGLGLASRKTSPR